MAPWFGRFRGRWCGRVAALPLVVGGAVVAWLVVATHRRLTHPAPALLNDWDEGYAMAFARRMLEGHNLPYVDAISHRGPVFYWMTAAFARLWGTDGWGAMRAASTASIGLTAATLVALGALGGRPLGGVLAALGTVAAIVIGFGVGDGLAFNAEHPVNVFSLGALLAACIAVRRRPHPAAGWLLLSGGLVSLAALSKQVGMAALLPVAVPLLAALAAPGTPRRVRLGALGALAAGVALPFAAVLVRYGAVGHLRTFWYWYYTYNAVEYLGVLDAAARRGAVAGATLRRFDVLLAATAVAALALARFALTTRRRRWIPRGAALSPLEVSAGLGALITLVGANASLRDFPHYYVQAVPWLALSVGLLIDRTLGLSAASVRLAPGRAALARTLVLAPLLALVVTAWRFRVATFAKDRFVRQTTSQWAVCRAIEKHVPRERSIFVWGFDPAAYTACNRRPASRFVYTTFVAGFVPFVERPRAVELQHAAPGATAQLLEDLAHDPPAMFIDSPKSLRGRSATDYPFLKALLDRDYCPTKIDLGGPKVYLQRSGKRCPAP